MVWFQCEDCGENLKKPKLLNHFRICSATKLSCIDCGVMFGQDTVQGHVQCITEAEKYGPKGQGKHASGATLKPAKNGKPQPEIDVNVGLSERPPWFCSLCNTSATSKQTLLGHADGKKHRAKARAFHAANQQTKPTEESFPASNVPTEETKMEGGVANKHPAEGDQQVPKADHGQSECENGEVQPKKRKVGAVGDDPTKKSNGSDNIGEVGAENIETKKAKVERTKRPLKEANHNIIENGKDVESAHTKKDTKHKIKWKKLIKSALKSDPKGALKMKKLKKIVLKSLGESGVTKDENELDNILEQKISSSSKFRVEGKLIHLEDKD